MTTRFRSPRVAASAFLLAFGLGLAGCADEAPQPTANDSNEVVTEIAPAAPEPVEAPAPVEEAADVNAAVAAPAPAPAPVGVEEEPVSVDQQTLEDADATGMTSRYGGEDAAQGTSAGDETAPAN